MTKNYWLLKIFNSKILFTCNNLSKIDFFQKRGFLTKVNKFCGVFRGIYKSTVRVKFRGIHATYLFGVCLLLNTYAEANSLDIFFIIFKIIQEIWCSKFCSLYQNYMPAVVQKLNKD